METNNKTNKRCTFSILFVINRSKRRKDGTCQLLCRVSIDGRCVQIGTRITVAPAIWDAKKGLATGRTQKALEVNKEIKELHERVVRHYNEIRTSLGFVNTELVKNALKGIAQKPTSLIKLFEEHNAEFEKRVGIDRTKPAYDVYVVTCKYLSAYIRGKYSSDDVTLKSLNLDFYNGFELYLTIDRGLGKKTVHQHLYNLKKITKRAFHQGTLRRDPYMQLFPELPRPKSRHIRLEDLQKLMQYRPAKKNLEFIRDLFVFSTFTGLCYADLKNFSEEHITAAEDGRLWIKMKRQKTGTEFHVRLMEIPLQIMEKYRHKREDGRIFKVYCRKRHYDLVRELGKQCGIGHITFHMARHNFGTHITLSQGVSIETVSRMMGHKSISMTQIYAKVSDKKVDEDMKGLVARTASKRIPLYEDKEQRAAIRYPGNANKTINEPSNNI